MRREVSPNVAPRTHSRWSPAIHHLRCCITRPKHQPSDDISDPAPERAEAPAPTLGKRWNHLFPEQLKRLQRLLQGHPPKPMVGTKHVVSTTCLLLHQLAPDRLRASDH